MLRTGKLLNFLWPFPKTIFSGHAPGNNTGYGLMLSERNKPRFFHTILLCPYCTSAIHSKHRDFFFPNVYFRFGETSRAPFSYQFKSSNRLIQMTAWIFFLNNSTNMISFLYTFETKIFLKYDYFCNFRILNSSNFSNIRRMIQNKINIFSLFVTHMKMIKMIFLFVSKKKKVSNILALLLCKLIFIIYLCRD